jgi:hypothetical protein
MLPACIISHVDETARRNTCLNNMKQIGLALHDYASVMGSRFPGSAEVIDKGGEKEVGGWSFLVKLLPYFECGARYDSLSPSSDPEAAEAARNTIRQYLVFEARRTPAHRRTDQL